MKHKKAFTLIELLVVIAVIAVLASIVFASLGSARNKAQEVKSIAELAQLKRLVDIEELKSPGDYEAVLTSLFGESGDYKDIVDESHSSGDNFCIEINSYCIDSANSAGLGTCDEITGLCEFSEGGIYYAAYNTNLDIHYTSVEEAVTAAEEGNTINIYGENQENIVVSTSGITLKGMTDSSIEGSIQLSSHSLTLQDITFINAVDNTTIDGWDFQNTEIIINDSSNVSIENSIFDSSSVIEVSGNSSDVNINYNIVLGSITNNSSNTVNSSWNYWGGCPYVSGIINSCPYFADSSMTMVINNIVATANPNTINLGETSLLSASGGSNYSWDNSLGAGSSKIVSPTETTEYTVCGEDANGCSGACATVTITVNP